MNMDEILQKGFNGNPLENFVCAFISKESKIYVPNQYASRLIMPIVYKGSYLHSVIALTSGVEYISSQ